MADSALTRLWTRVKEYFDKDAEHLQRVRFDDPNGPELLPNDSYVRLVVSELFVKDSVRWGTERFPAVQAAARLAYGGRQPLTFATLVRPSEQQLGPGLFEDYELTYLMPYLGQSIEIEVALYEILGEKRLETALDVLSDFASLVAPPVSSVVAVMDKVASGIDKVITANGSAPVLAVHGTFSPSGAGADVLRPGWLAAVRATEAELPQKELRIVDGRLHRVVGTSTTRLEGFDYVVLRIEGKASRADGAEWLAPDVDRALSDARLARDTGTPEEFTEARKALLTKVYYSPDFSPSDRKRIAQLVKEELDDQTEGAAGRGADSLSDLVSARGLPSRDDVEALTLAALLA